MSVFALISSGQDRNIVDSDQAFQDAGGLEGRTLLIKNLDPTPMEFESKTLKVEKVLSGNSEAVVNIRAQKAGRYDFFDDFHANTTKGVLVVK